PSASASSPREPRFLRVLSDYGLVRWPLKTKRWDKSQGGCIEPIRWRVRVAPCDARGNVKGEWAEGSARSLQDEGARQADRMLDDKYGWQRSLIRLLTRLRRRPRAAYAIRLA